MITMMTRTPLDILRDDPRYAACVALGHQLVCSLMHQVATAFPDLDASAQIRLALMVLQDGAEVLTRAGHLFVEHR